MAYDIWHAERDPVPAVFRWLVGAKIPKGKQPSFVTCWMYLEDHPI